jgi:hypothetical protein
LVLRDYNRRVSYEQRKIRESERAAERAVNSQARNAAQLDAIQDRYIKRDYDRRVTYEQRKIAEAEQLASQAAARQQQLVTQGITMLGGVAAVGLNVLIDGYEKIRTHAVEAAEATLKLRQTLAMEATLGGAGQTTEPAIQKAIGFRVRTGLGEKEATDFTRQYEGTTPIAFQKGNITQQVADELRVQAGIRTARQGGEAGTSAELAGILGQFGKVTSVKAGLSQLEAIRTALVEGRGDDPELNRQLLNVSGAMVKEGGVVPSLPEMAALIGVTSLSGGATQAGDRANQLYRGLRIGLTKHTRVKGSDQAQADYLESLGITAKDTLESTLDKLVPDLAKARESGQDLDLYLASKNFRASEQRRAIIETFENYAPLKERMARAREAGLNEQLGEDEIAKNQEFLASPQGRFAVSKALGAAATVTRGVKAERLRVLTEETEASPEIQEGDESQATLFTDFMRGFVVNPKAPAEAGRRIRVEAQMARNLRRRATRAGVPEEEYAAMDPTGIIGPSGPNAMRDFVNRVESLIAERGGESAVETLPVLQEMDKSLKEIVTLFGDRKKAPAPLPAAPRAGAVRP